MWSWHQLFKIWTKIFFKLFLYLFTSLCVCAHAWAHACMSVHAHQSCSCYSVHVEDRGQFGGAGCLQPWEIWRSNSGRQTWWQVLIPTEISHHPQNVLSLMRDGILAHEHVKYLQKHRWIAMFYYILIYLALGMNSITSSSWSSKCWFVGGGRFAHCVLTCSK